MTTRVAATSSLRHVVASYIARAKTICIKMNVASRPPAILLEIARHARGIYTNRVHARCSRTRCVPIKTYVNFSKAISSAEIATSPVLVTLRIFSILKIEIVMWIMRRKSYTFLGIKLTTVNK